MSADATLEAKYYPMVLVGLFALLNGPAVLCPSCSEAVAPTQGRLSDASEPCFLRPDVAALILGYLHSRARVDSMLPSDGKLQRWEPDAKVRMLL